MELFLVLGTGIECLLWNQVMPGDFTSLTFSVEEVVKVT